MSKPKEKNNTNKEYLITSANLGNVFWEEMKLAIGLISQSLSSEEWSSCGIRGWWAGRDSMP